MVSYALSPLPSLSQKTAKCTARRKNDTLPPPRHPREARGAAYFGRGVGTAARARVVPWVARVRVLVGWCRGDWFPLPGAGAKMDEWQVARN